MSDKIIPARMVLDWIRLIDYWDGCNDEYSCSLSWDAAERICAFVMEHKDSIDWVEVKRLADAEYELPTLMWSISGSGLMELLEKHKIGWEARK